MLVRAAAKQGVDFRAADALSRSWWTRTKWILDQMDTDSQLDIFRLQHAQNLAIIPGVVTDKQGFRKHWDNANDLLTQIFNEHFPWQAKDSSRTDQITQMRTAWIARWGDPNSPEGKQRIDNTVRELERRNKIAGQKNLLDTFGRGDNGKEADNKPSVRGHRARRKLL